MSFDFPTEVLREGRVSVMVPRLKAYARESWEYAPSRAPVFYNPAMELNRDVAVLALQAYQRIMSSEISVCEPLTGCGVRGIRFAIEVDGVRKVIVNDINPEAAKLARFNVDQAKLAEHFIVTNEDANLLLSQYAAPRKRFNFIDIDPFGSPMPYLDSALRALRDNGLLALTATDMAPLCGVHPQACVRKYGGKPLRTEYCHELAVRLLIGGLTMTAAKHDMGIDVVFSHSTDHYIRVYAIARYGARQADNSILMMGYILHCFACFHREPSKGMSPLLKRECTECGSKLNVAGPLYLGKLWNEEFCTQMQEELKGKTLRYAKEIIKLLSLIKNEINAPVTYYVIDKVCDKFNLPVPALSEIMGELGNAGFRVARTHFNSKAFRTDAPAQAVREIVTKLVTQAASS